MPLAFINPLNPTLKRHKASVLTTVTFTINAERNTAAPNSKRELHRTVNVRRRHRGTLL